MTQAEYYIARIDEELRAYDDRSAGDLVKEIIAVFSSADSLLILGLDRDKSRAIVPGQVVRYDNKGDLKKLRGKLLVQIESERKNLKGDPILLALASVDEDIDECKRLISNGNDDDRRRCVDRMVRVYEVDIKNFAVGLSGYGFGSEEEDLRGDLELILGHLRHYRAKIALESVSGSMNTVNIQASAVNQNSVTNVLTITQVAEQVQSIPDSVLDDDLKNELKCLLLDLDAVKNKPKAESESRLQKALAWMSDKGVDVAIAVLPYIASFISTLV